MNKTELEYEIELKEILNSSEIFRMCLDLLKDAPVSDIWLTGGIIRNIVWNKLHGYDETYGIDDIDIIFHSIYVSVIYDRKILDYTVSFTNQNDIHKYLKEVTGVYIEQFESCEDALRSFTDTCSAILVREIDGELEIKSHSGLKDLMEGIIRPICDIPELSSKYKSRLEKWKVERDYPLIKIEYVPGINLITNRISTIWYLENEIENEITDMLKSALDLKELGKYVKNAQSKPEQHQIYITNQLIKKDGIISIVIRYPGMTVGVIDVSSSGIIMDISMLTNFKSHIFHLSELIKLRRFIGWKMLTQEDIDNETIFASKI